MGYLPDIAVLGSALSRSRPSLVGVITVTGISSVVKAEVCYVEMIN